VTTVQVLIVDDQVPFRRAAARVLARLSDFVLIGESESGEASVEAARALQPDLILMDIHLPGIDGPEATRRILADVEEQKAPPVVFLLSTYEAADYAAETLACGAAAYLAKGEFGPAALLSAWAAARPPRLADRVTCPRRGDPRCGG
jgi:DNA-binding NarL/FixJ family response regulator